MNIETGITPANLARAFLWRILKERGKTILLAPAGVMIFLSAFAVIAYAIPGLLTGPTMTALRQYAGQNFPDASQSKGMLCAALFAQGPFLMALLVAFSASGSASALITGEMRRGTFEILFSGIKNTTELVLGLMLTAVGISIVDWGLCMVTALAVSAAFVFFADAWRLVDMGQFIYGFTLSIPMALLGTATGTTISLKWPWVAQHRIGTTGNITQLVGALPSVLLLLYITFNPAADVAAVVTAAWFVSLMLFVLVCFGLAVGIKRTHFIGSSGV